MITVVGTGTGTPLVDDVLAGARLVVGGRRHLAAVTVPPDAEQIVLGPLAPALDTIEAYVGKGEPVVEIGRAHV